MPSEIERLRKLVADAAKLLNEAPLLDHSDRGPKSCLVCKWQNKLQRWHDHLPETVSEVKPC